MRRNLPKQTQLQNQEASQFRFHPQVKEYFWLFIEAVKKYEEIRKDAPTLIPLWSLICIIESGMRVWANQLSPELSKAFANLYIGHLAASLSVKSGLLRRGFEGQGDSDEDTKTRWDLLHKTAKQMADDLEAHFALIHMKDDDA